MKCLVGRSLAIVLLNSTLVLAGPVAAPSRSAVVAKQLTAALAAHQLDAIAAKDPDEADRFIAALYYPGVQLLVVSARFSVPAALDAKLAQQQFHDIYLDLQGSAIAHTSMFYEDLNADGLCANRDQAADIFYDGSGAPKVFDADWEKHKLSQKSYEEQYAEADRQYARMLQILLGRHEPSATTR
jgi:hypothetical protein